MRDRNDANGSFSSAIRFGPTASISPTMTPTLASSNHLKTAAVGFEDDDDMDDPLHTFTAAEKRDLSSSFDWTSLRGWANGLTLAVMALGVLMLFGGYPVISHVLSNNNASGGNTAGYNLGGINATGQFPDIAGGLPRLIDPDTPASVMTRTGFDGQTWNLVFSDEFNKEGRTFYNGDDPFFEAVDIHYWPTGDFEWYDPSAVTTKDGHLLITITQEPMHGLNFKSGMIQSWNKLCFNKNAYFEVSASLPGTSTVGGFWPGIWTMGNLGRPGYGASTDGLWPYSYDSCDIGTLANQTYVNGTGPAAALTTGSNDGTLSYLPGQRYSACTCPGEFHPGPSNDVGRSSPEIDMVEAQIIINEATGEVSQSNQIAPFDDEYRWDNRSASHFTVYDTSLTKWNTYLGGVYQQAVSALTKMPDRIYWSQDTVPGAARSKEFAVFGFEYYSNKAKREDGYIAWVVDNKRSWTMYADATAANPRVGVGRRLVSEEPMAMIFNLAMSNNFQTVDFANLIFPNYLRVDYIRVWQKPEGTIGCDPADHPTAAMIARYPEVYNNPNLTTWEATGNAWPKNRLKDTC